VTGDSDRYLRRGLVAAIRWFARLQPRRLVAFMKRKRALGNPRKHATYLRFGTFEEWTAETRVEKEGHEGLASEP
jgi:hypothetical protein